MIQRALSRRDLAALNLEAGRSTVALVALSNGLPDGEVSQKDAECLFQLIEEIIDTPSLPLVLAKLAGLAVAGGRIQADRIGTTLESTLQEIGLKWALEELA